MSQSLVYFVGTPAEVEHHAAPLQGRLPLCIVDPERVVDVARPGDLAIFYSEHFDRFRFACQTLKKQRVATVYLIDGILEWRNAWENQPDEPACPYAMRPVLAHKAACIGASQARILDSWGNAEKTEVVGIPRFDLLNGIEKKGRKSNEFHLLVMTAKTPGFSARQNEVTEQSLRDLKHSISKLAGQIQGRSIRVTWRLTAGFDERIGVQNQLADLSGRELAEVLQGVDAVISTPSTAMLEAMLMDIPVASLDYHHCPTYLPTAWKISGPGAIETTMLDMASPPESKRLYQQAILADALQTRESATDRVQCLIEAMLATAGQQIEHRWPLKFPARMLEPVDSRVAEPNDRFNHALIYPEAAEFSKEDIRELQVELSHARREIRHLQREKDQLATELKEAHEIFEEIHRHPIAGPVVRIRQRILHWLAGRRRLQDGMEVEVGSIPATSTSSDS